MRIICYLLFILIFCLNISSLFSQEYDVSKSVILSNTGSSRATSYTDSNKIVETDSSLYILSLDFINKKYCLILKKVNKCTSELVEESIIDDHVFDNHGGGAIVMDSEGFFHIVFDGHNRPFKYVRSQIPYSIEKWSSPELIGSRLTYPTLAIDSNDNLYLIGRYSKIAGNWGLEFYQKRNNEDWSNGTQIFEATQPLTNPKISPYIRTSKSMAIGKNDIIHLALKMYEFLPDKIRNDNSDPKNAVSYFVGYLYSDDKGNTWKSGGERISLPANISMVESIAGVLEPHKATSYFNISNISLDRENKPWIMYIEEYKSVSRAFLAHRTKNGWTRHEIKFEGGRIFGSSAICVDTSNIYVVSNYISAPRYHRHRLWGHIENRVVSFQVKREDFQIHDISLKDGPSWLPSIINTKTHDELPWFIYTVGLSGDKNTKVIASQFN